MESTRSTTPTVSRRSTSRRPMPRGRSRRGQDSGQLDDSSTEFAQDEILSLPAASIDDRASALSLVNASSRPNAWQQLHGAHGNRHVQRIVDSLKLRRAGNPVARQSGGEVAQRATPADVNIGFNPMDIVHKLVIAIDSAQVKFPEPVRKVDFNGVLGALKNPDPITGASLGLSVAEAKIVKDAYQKHEKNRSLDQDLFGNGESGFPSDLKPDQRLRLKALLAGTRSEGKQDPGAKDAAANNRQAEAAELHQLLNGDLDKADVERVMAMLRRSPQDNLDLSAAYATTYSVGLTGAFYRMGSYNMVRALQLFMGRAIDADRMVVSANKSIIENIDKEIAAINKANWGGLGDVVAKGQINALQTKRRALADELSQRAEASIMEAKATAANQGGDVTTVAQAAKARAAAVLGDVNATAAAVGGTDWAVIRAVASDDPVEKAAAQLRKASDRDKLTAAEIASTLRGLRTEAEQRAQLENPKAQGDELAAKTKAKTSEYFNRLRASYNMLVVMTGGQDFDTLIDDTGKSGDADLNKALLAKQGQLSDVEELVLALRGDRKDTEAVEKVLKSKTVDQIKLLKAQYSMMTLGQRSLDYDLFGEAPTTADGDNPEYMGRYAKYQGKASGTSRLNLEDYLQRPSKEGGFEEVAYISSRAEREYQYTIDNRGATGAWRDAWGNEQRTLLDETIKEVRTLYTKYFYSKMDPKWVHSDDARDTIRKMRLARATIRGDRDAYEKAVAELRATFQAIAAFALQIALSAVLGPLVAMAGRLVKGVSMAIKVVKAAVKVAAEALVNTAASIGANLAAYQDAYSLAMFKSDLFGGFGGAIGPAVAGPAAKALVSRLGPKLSKEIIKYSETLIGKEVVGIGNTAAGMTTGALVQGEAPDLTLAKILHAHGMGRISNVATEKLQHRMGYRPRATGDGTTETTTPPQSDGVPEHIPTGHTEPVPVGGGGGGGGTGSGSGGGGSGSGKVPQPGKGAPSTGVPEHIGPAGDAPLSPDVSTGVPEHIPTGKSGSVGTADTLPVPVKPGGLGHADTHPVAVPKPDPDIGHAKTLKPGEIVTGLEPTLPHPAPGPELVKMAGESGSKSPEKPRARPLGDTQASIAPVVEREAPHPRIAQAADDLVRAVRDRGEGGVREVMSRLSNREAEAVVAEVMGRLQENPSDPALRGAANLGWQSYAGRPLPGEPKPQ